MKSMTDFIMEQEIQTTVEAAEVFEESTLVSDYMALCASTKMMECVCEFATIGAFCESNEITVPAVIQEGWAEFWSGVKNFFVNIGKWFKSLIKGTISAVQKASLPAVIAKLKQKNPSKNVKDEKIAFMAATTELIWKMLKDFKDLLEGTVDVYKTKADAAAGVGDVIDEKKTNEIISKIDDLKEDLDSVLKDKSWKDDGKLKNLDLKYSGGDIKSAAKAAGEDPENMTVEDLINCLTAINAVNIPTEGEKLLKQFDVKWENFKAVKVAESKGEGGAGVKKGDTYVTDKKDDELIKTLKKTADSFAKAYDKVTQGLISLAKLEADDIEVKDQEKLEADTKRAELSTKSLSTKEALEKP